MLPTLTGTEECIKSALEIRAILQRVADVFEAPHIPQLSPEEVLKIKNKIEWIINNETRAAFYETLIVTVETPKGTTENPTRIGSMLLKWCGRRSRKYKEPTKKAGHAANGRVIRDMR